MLPEPLVTARAGTPERRIHAKKKMLKTTRAPKIKDHHGPDATRALVTARIEELRKAEARNAAKQGKGTAAQRQLAALTKAAAAHLAAR